MLCPLRSFNAPSGCRFDVLACANKYCDPMLWYRCRSLSYNDNGHCQVHSLFRMVLPSRFMVAVNYCTAVLPALNNLRLSDIKLYENYLKRLQKIIDGLGIVAVKFIFASKIIFFWMVSESIVLSQIWIIFGTIKKPRGHNSPRSYNQHNWGLPRPRAFQSGRTLMSYLPNNFFIPSGVIIHSLVLEFQL